jgi:hypothetical protein
MRALYIGLFAFTVSLSAHAQTTNYQVYSLFVMNIAKYSSWPNLSGDFNISVFGKSKAYDELMKQNNKIVNGHTIKVTQVEDIAQLANAQIIYLPDGRSSALDDIVKATLGKSVMIITEREGLFKKGAGFSFIVMENSTLRYDINSTDLEKRQIKISKNLTALANSTM